jgi:hypothetical protein
LLDEDFHAPFQFVGRNATYILLRAIRPRCPPSIAPSPGALVLTGGVSRRNAGAAVTQR